MEIKPFKPVFPIIRSIAFYRGWMGRCYLKFIEWCPPVFPTSILLEKLDKLIWHLYKIRGEIYWNTRVHVIDNQSYIGILECSKGALYSYIVIERYSNARDELSTVMFYSFKLIQKDTILCETTFRITEDSSLIIQYGQSLHECTLHRLHMLFLYVHNGQKNLNSS